MGYYINPFTSRIERYDKFIPDEWGVRVLKSVNYDGIWKKKTSLPYNCQDAYIAHSENMIYVICGYDGNVKLQKFIFYDKANDSWGENTDVTFSARSNGGCVYYNEKLYLFGGEDAVGVLNEVKIYDLSSSTWSDGAQMPTGLKDFAFTVNNDKVYIAGGYDGNNYNNKLFIYDMTNDSFEELAILPDDRKLFDIIYADEKIYFLGGKDSNDNFIEENFIYYDILNNEFKYKTEKPFKKLFCSPNLVYCGGRIYIINATYKTDKEYMSFDISLNLWRIHQYPLDIYITNTKYIYDETNCYIVGGNNGSSIVNSLFHINLEKIEEYDIYKLVKF